jgi:hypothetical protein
MTLVARNMISCSLVLMRRRQADLRSGVTLLPPSPVAPAAAGRCRRKAKVQHYYWSRTYPSAGIPDPGALPIVIVIVRRYLGLASAETDDLLGCRQAGPMVMQFHLGLEITLIFFVDPASGNHDHQAQHAPYSYTLSAPGPSERSSSSSSSLSPYALVRPGAVEL